MSFGDKFRALREQKGLTQASCDEIFDLMRGTVSNWENNYTEPEEELLPEIAGFFRISVRELVSDTPLAG